MENAVIDLQNRQRKTQGQLNDLESRLETHRQILAAEIQKLKKEGDPLKKHLADMFSRLERMETRIQEITGLSDEDRYRFHQIIGGLKNMEQSVNRKFVPLEQQIQSLEAQVRTLLESYQELISQIQAFEKLEKNAMARLAKVEHNVKSLSLDRVKVPAKPPAAEQPVPKQKAHQEFYNKAIQKLKSGDYELARKMFEEYLRKYPSENLAPNAQYWIGESYYNQGKYEEAILQFDKVVRNHPKSDKVAGAILKEAMAFCKMGDNEGCRLFLNKVMQDFPKSPEAKKAEQELEKLK